MSHDSHFLPAKIYVKSIIALLILTVLTVVVAKPISGFDAGVLNVFIAMSIATVKATIVLAFFMQLKYSNKLFLAIILTGVLFLCIMFGFCYLDITSRAFQPSTL